MRAAGDPDLKIYGVFGFPLSHSMSPAMHNGAFDHLGLKSLYFAFERTPRRFRALMRHRRTLLLDGFNLTIPFKEVVMSYLDRLSREAKVIGSVNTVKKMGRQWVGFNTDHFGFSAGLKGARFHPKGKSAVILGAGGSARAVAYALARSGIRSVVIANRTRSRARALTKRFRGSFKRVHWQTSPIRGSQFKKVLSHSDLIVNATKVGLKKSDPSLIPRSLMPKRGALVYDLIYNPTETRLLRIAKQKRNRVSNGVEMLLWQGMKAFEIWTGRRAPGRTMKKALYDALRAQ